MIPPQSRRRYSRSCTIRKSQTLSFSNAKLGTMSPWFKDAHFPSDGYWKDMPLDAKNGLFAALPSLGLGHLRPMTRKVDAKWFKAYATQWAKPFHLGLMLDVRILEAKEHDVKLWKPGNKDAAYPVWRIISGVRFSWGEDKKRRVDKMYYLDPRQAGYVRNLWGFRDADALAEINTNANTAEDRMRKLSYEAERIVGVARPITHVNQSTLTLAQRAEDKRRHFSYEQFKKRHRRLLEAF